MTGSSSMIAENPINTFSGGASGMPKELAPTHTPRPTAVAGSIPQIAENPISPATGGATGLPLAPRHTSGPAVAGGVPMVAENPTNPITSASAGMPNAQAQTPSPTAVAGSNPQIAENPINPATGGATGLPQAPALTSGPAVAGSSISIAENPINLSSTVPVGAPMAVGPTGTIAEGQAMPSLLTAQAPSSMPTGGTLSASAAVVGGGPISVSFQSHDLDDMECEYTGYVPAIQGPALSGFAPQIGGSNVAAAATSGGVTSGWGQTGLPHGGNTVSQHPCAPPPSSMPTGLPTTTAPAIVATDTLFPPGHKVKLEIPKTSLAQFTLPTVVWPPLPEVLPTDTLFPPGHQVQLEVPKSSLPQFTLPPVVWPPLPQLLPTDTLFPPGHTVKLEVPESSLVPFHPHPLVSPPLPQLLPVEMDWEPTPAEDLLVPVAVPSTGSVLVAGAPVAETAVAASPASETPGVAAGTAPPPQPTHAMPEPVALLRKRNWNRDTGVSRDSICTSDASKWGSTSMETRPRQPANCDDGERKRWKTWRDVRIIREPTQSRPEERRPPYQPPPAPTHPVRPRPALALPGPIWGPNQIRMLKVGVVCYGLLLGASYFGLI
jgi:hypothetical protein